MIDFSRSMSSRDPQKRISLQGKRKRTVRLHTITENIPERRSLHDNSERKSSIDFKTHRAKETIVQPKTNIKKGLCTKFINFLEVLLTLWEYPIILLFLTLCLVNYSIVCIPQILCCIIYLYVAVNIEKVYFQIRVYISLMLCFYSIFILLTKILLSSLLISNAIISSDIVMKSLGITIAFDNIYAREVIKTYL